MENYRPVLSLLICAKIFERLISNELFNILLENNLISPNQSGFKPEDSCFNQLLSITHKIYNSFYKELEVRSVFLDISKAFEKVWHRGLLFKLSGICICGNLFDLLCSFLSDRKPRVFLNGQISEWQNVTAGIPQDSILGPLFFFDIHKRFIWWPIL